VFECIRKRRKRGELSTKLESSKKRSNEAWKMETQEEDVFQERRVGFEGKEREKREIGKTWNLDSTTRARMKRGKQALENEVGGVTSR